MRERARVSLFLDHRRPLGRDRRQWFVGGTHLRQDVAHGGEVVHGEARQVLRGGHICAQLVEQVRQVWADVVDEVEAGRQ